MLIGELAERTGVSARSLRYYEARGLLEPARTGGDYRVYVESDVRRVGQIRVLLRAGFDVRSVAAVLPCLRGEGAATAVDLCPAVEAAMRSTLARVEDDLADLGRRRSTLRGLLAGGSAGGGADSAAISGGSR